MHAKKPQAALQPLGVFRDVGECGGRMTAILEGPGEDGGTEAVISNRRLIS